MNNSNVQCDVVIIGAGIAGIYAAHKLRKKLPDYDIKIFEKSANSGGRIYSEQLTSNAGVVDLGAGRYNRNVHQNLDCLMKEFSIECKAFDYQIAPLQNDLFEQNRSNLKCICQSLKTYYQSCSDEEQERWSFWDAAGQHLGEQRRQLLMTASGYDSLKNPKLPFNHGFDILFGHPETEALSGEPLNHWFAPVHGFQSLPDAMLKDVLKYCDLYTDHQLMSIEHSILCDQPAHKLVFNTGTGCCTVKSNYVIQATPVQDLFNIDGLSMGDTLTESVVGVPLVKGYVQYPYAWWRTMNINGCCFTNPSVFRKIYFPKQGSHLLIYTDGDSATQLQQLSASENDISMKFEQVVKQALPYDAASGSIPKPLKHEWKYWEKGISFWDGGLNMLPQGVWSPAPNYYICSDMCTENIGWVEGAIESANACVDKIIPSSSLRNRIESKKKVMIEQVYSVAEVA